MNIQQNDLHEYSVRFKVRLASPTRRWIEDDPSPSLYPSSRGQTCRCRPCRIQHTFSIGQMVGQWWPALAWRHYILSNITVVDGIFALFHQYFRYRHKNGTIVFSIPNVITRAYFHFAKHGFAKVESFKHIIYSWAGMQASSIVHQPDSIFLQISTETGAIAIMNFLFFRLFHIIPNIEGMRRRVHHNIWPTLPIICWAR